jgi:hypothetical protein
MNKKKKRKRKKRKMCMSEKRYTHLKKTYVGPKEHIWHRLGPLSLLSPLQNLLVLKNVDRTFK